MHKLKITQDLCNLPVDQYSRQFWAAQFIESIRQGKEQFKIVDVGGYKGQTKVFQPKDDVLVCDLFDVEEEGYVKADGTKLPFKDGQFDIAVTFDAYEHIPTAKREKFIKELLRVSKKAAIVAAPFDDKTYATIDAEKRLNSYYRDLYGREHRWLEEHISLKTPQADILETQLRTEGYKFAKFYTNDRIIWELLQSVYFSIELDHKLRERTHELNWLYNTNVTKVDPSREGESYRTIYIISKDASLVSGIQKFISTLPAADRQYSEEYVAKIMSVFGLMYRDVVHHRDYLQQRVDDVDAGKLKSLKNRVVAARNSILPKRKR